jgi:hypothetical protein
VWLSLVVFGLLMGLSPHQAPESDHERDEARAYRDLIQELKGMQMSNERPAMNWWTLLERYGVPSAIALFLVWFMTTRIQNDMKDMSLELRGHATISASTASRLESFTQDSRAESRSMISLLRQVCVNTAKTDEQRRECVR